MGEWRLEQSTWVRDRTEDQTDQPIKNMSQGRKASINGTFEG